MIFQRSRKSLSGEKKHYLSDLSFYYALNTDNRINYGPDLENILLIYALGKGYSASVGKIGKLECDFIFRNDSMDYSYAYTILPSRETEDREYRSLESIRIDNYPRYLLTLDTMLQKRNGTLTILEAFAVFLWPERRLAGSDSEVFRSAL